MNRHFVCDQVLFLVYVLLGAYQSPRATAQSINCTVILSTSSDLYTFNVCPLDCMTSRSPTYLPATLPTSVYDNQSLSSGVLSAIVTCGFFFVVLTTYAFYRYCRFLREYKHLPLHKLLHRGTKITKTHLIDHCESLHKCDSTGYSILEAIFNERRLDLIAEEVICMIVEKSVERHIEDGTLLQPGSLGVWASLVQQSDDVCFSAMKTIVSRFESNVVALANGTDRHGRRCIDIASIRMKEELLKCIYFLRRFELTPGPAEHKSATSMVILAIDHGPEEQSAPATSNKYSRKSKFQIAPAPANQKSVANMLMLATDDGTQMPSEPKISSMTSRKVTFTIAPLPFAKEQQNRKVVLKFMKHRNQFLSEINVRAKANLQEDFVITVLDSFDGSENPEFMAACKQRGFADYPFCLVMPLAEINLERVIRQRNIAGSDWDAIRHIMRTLCNALFHIHSKCIVHGDLKPSNLVLVEDSIRLIDFDAGASFGRDSTDYAGVKYSTANLPPEMFWDFGCFLKSCPRDETINGYELVRPSPCHDMWAVGVILYLLCTGCDLYITSVEGQCDRHDQFHIFSWTPSMKAAKLSNVTHRYARNLLSLLLSKDPSLRPSAERVLMHPFITGQQSVRLQGEAPEFDVFISYRVATDGACAELIYTTLTGLGLKVWWDKVSLLPGQPWDEGFCSGLINSSCFVCLLSNAAIFNSAKPQNNINMLRRDSHCDNVVLEWRLALEMRARGMIEGIFPILIADKEPTPAGKSIHSGGGCHPNKQPLPDCIVQSLEETLREHLEMHGLGSPLLDNMTIKEVIAMICACQGGLLKGDSDLVLPSVCESIRAMCEAITKAPGRNADPKLFDPLR
jgi:serine/threonine protein kinase